MTRTARRARVMAIPRERTTLAARVMLRRARAVALAKERMALAETMMLRGARAVVKSASRTMSLIHAQIATNFYYHLIWWFAHSVELRSIATVANYGWSQRIISSAPTAHEVNVEKQPKTTVTNDKKLQQRK